MANDWKRGTFTYDAGLGHTPTTLMNAIQSFLTQVGWERASWDSTTIRRFMRTDRGSSNYWMFNGDGSPQACGIRVELDTPNTRVIIRTFLETAGATAEQRASVTGHQAFIPYDNTAPNNLLFIGGLKGFYYEDGRDGLPTNLAHGMVVAWEPIPEFNGTDDLRVNLTTQGAVCDLFGALKFSESRIEKLGDSRLANRNYTGRLKPYVVRGPTGLNGQAVVNDPQVGVGPRDNIFSTIISGGGTAYNDAVTFTFGLTQTPRDNRYRISPLMVSQVPTENVSVGASGAGNTDAPNSNALFRDIRALRQSPRFAVVDGTLVPFVNITDAATSLEYRVAQVADSGRPANIGIEWPGISDVVTVSGA